MEVQLADVHLADVGISVDGVALPFGVAASCEEKNFVAAGGAVSNSSEFSGAVVAVAVEVQLADVHLADVNLADAGVCFQPGGKSTVSLVNPPWMLPPGMPGAKLPEIS